MATRSRIGIEKEDGTVESIYCHWDGYPSNNGVILQENYQDREKVEELISLGGISALRMRVKPNEDEVHTFETPLDDVTISYHRDRGGMKYSKPRVDENKDLYFRSDLEEWGYLYTKENEWIVTDGYHRTDPVTLREYFDKEPHI